ncbi:MAG: SDR family oxidoreductase [Armatimonadota bacterium]|nr:SDR family oxidoreductase [Armatimonadota bacterium]MDR7534115.1 SDR family oxidoreductase [Armatimonadota bacterium]MDR7535710.1 SDR family oxidoreductase [Armatimonadota bacterium]
MGGRVVIVTGASSGIGEATARAFGRAGDRVVLVARRADRLQQLAAGLPDALVVPADLTRAGDVERVASATRERYGRIDVLVNNAGLGRYDWLEHLPVAEIESQLQVNLLAPILLSRAVLPVMLAQRRGVIVNVGSVAGRIATPTMSIYNAAKFGLDGFSEALRREVGPQGVHICVITPGPVEGTEFGAHGATGRGLRAVRGRWRQLRWLRTDADRVAAAIVQLADRPQPRRVLPGIYRAMIAVNTLAPGLVDRIVGRAAQAARPTEPPTS